VEDYGLYLAKLAELAKQVYKTGSRTGYPESLNTTGKRVLYDNLEQDEALTVSPCRCT
jgi:type I restriction enzyme, R subunit